MKKKIIIFVCLLALALSGCGGSKSEINPKESVVNIETAGDDTAFMYTANILKSVDWNDMTSIDQGQFAQEVIDSVKEDESLDTDSLPYSVQGRLEDGDVAFFYNSDDPLVIKIWLNGKYADDYKIVK